MSQKTRFPIRNVIPFGYSTTRPGSDHQTVFPFGQYGLAGNPYTGSLDVPTWNFPFYQGDLVSETGDATLTHGTQTRSMVGAGIQRDYASATQSTGTPVAMGALCGVSFMCVLPWTVYGEPAAGRAGAGLLADGQEVSAFLSVESGSSEEVLLNVNISGTTYQTGTGQRTGYRGVVLHVSLLVDLTELVASAYINGEFVWSASLGSGVQALIGEDALPLVYGGYFHLDEVVVWADMQEVASYEDFDGYAADLYGGGRPWIYRSGDTGWLQPAATITANDHEDVSTDFDWYGMYGALLFGLVWTNGEPGAAARWLYMEMFDDDTHPVFVQLASGLGTTGAVSYYTKWIYADGVQDTYDVPWITEGPWTVFGPTVTLSGAGTSAVNGDYTPVGFQGGCLRFQYGSYYIEVATSGPNTGNWVVVNGGVEFYSLAANSSYVWPPMGSTWTVEAGGTGPGPTAAGAFATPFTILSV